MDLVEWAADLVMFNVRSLGVSGGAGQAAGGAIGGDLKNSSRSRVSTAASMRRSQQANKSQQRLGNKLAQMSSNTLLPTIFDETQATTVSMEVATISSHVEKSAEDELDMLIRKSKRDNLFGEFNF